MVNINQCNAWYVAERPTDTVVLCIDDYWATALDTSPVSHFAHTSTETSWTLHLFTKVYKKLNLMKPKYRLGAFYAIGPVNGLSLSYSSQGCTGKQVAGSGMPSTTRTIHNAGFYYPRPDQVVTTKCATRDLTIYTITHAETVGAFPNSEKLEYSFLKIGKTVHLDKSYILYYTMRKGCW